MTTDTVTLTTTQYSALAELRHRGALVASRHAFSGNTRTFSQRTLDALVDAGHARYEVVYGVPNAPAVASGIVPIDAPTPIPPASDTLTITVTRDDCSPQEIRALSRHAGTRGPGEKLTTAVDRIAEALHYGHPVTIIIGAVDGSPA